MNKSICVFCSASEVDEKYVSDARKFGNLVAQNGFDLVYGGSDHGLMKVIADAVQDAGGRVIGISVKHLSKIARKNATEMTIAKDLGQRKEMMLARSDAVVVLVGGIGTIDEVTDVLEQKKHNLHNKPVVVLNTDNFYEGLKVQFEKMKDEGFIPLALADLVSFAQTPSEAINIVLSKIQK